MPGPLPDPGAARRNAPTIPTTTLPASGFKGPCPEPPEYPTLGEAGRTWWNWAWRTPQAAGWGPGMESMIARRASLEDDLRVIAEPEPLDLIEVLNAKSAAEVRKVIGQLAGVVTGRLGVMREMRELDDRLGMTPKGLAALRWTIVDDDENPAAKSEGEDELTKRRQDRRKKLA